MTSAIDQTTNTQEKHERLKIKERAGGYIPQVVKRAYGQECCRRPGTVQEVPGQRGVGPPDLEPLAMWPHYSGSNSTRKGFKHERNEGTKDTYIDPHWSCAFGHRR